MIAQIVFDLPLDGPFDYLIPEQLIPMTVVGTRVKVSFGPKTQIGYVIGILEQSKILKLKPILSIGDTSAVFNSLELAFAQDFCAYYGCSLGEALSTILRNKESHTPSIQRDHKPRLTLHRCQPDSYAGKIQQIMDGYRRQYKDTAGDYCHFLILVPDSFRARRLSQQLHSLTPAGRDSQGGGAKIGTRSSVFESDGQHDCVIMVDDEDASYKQEQSPKYDALQVLLMRSKMFGFDVAFVGVSPSVELMALVRADPEARTIDEPADSAPPARLVDLTNYKFIPGLLSVPVREALERTFKEGKRSILVLNRRGSYRLTRCVDCGEILKCSHCDSSLIYSRSEGKYLCRYCTYTLAGDTVCPKCHKPSWRSQGIGVEQVQTELKKYFPQAKIFSFERAGRLKKSNGPVGGGESLPDFDILISTSAVLRFQGTVKAQFAAFIDFDAELNRLDMRSAFNAFSFVLHISSMALEAVFIQTRNINHYVLQSLSRGNIKGYYDEELELRKEFGFSPFKHWVKISWRGKLEKAAKEVAQRGYDGFKKSLTKMHYVITPPLADAVGRKRDQFRFNVMVQTPHVPPAVSLIKSTLQKIKRPRGVVMTLNVDP